VIPPRRSLRQLTGPAVVLGVLLACTATLAGALHVREIRVRGCQRFPAQEVENVLRTALGTPTVAARPDRLRGAVLAVPWVADAHVTVSLDGIVTCSVEERTPVAVAEDSGLRQLLDAEGRLLGPASYDVPPLLLEGFATVPEERAALLRAVAAMEAAWGGRLASARRLGPADVALRFAETPCLVLADPAAPERLSSARRVLAAWIAAAGTPPRRLDARLSDRVAVLPEAPTTAEEPS
jgi:hypothetical protein